MSTGDSGKVVRELAPVRREHAQCDEGADEQPGHEARGGACGKVVAEVYRAAGGVSASPRDEGRLHFRELDCVSGSGFLNELLYGRDNRLGVRGLLLGFSLDRLGITHVRSHHVD